MKWLKHAFAIDDSEISELTPEDQELVRKLCEQIVRRGLSVPALFLLETFRPLNYLSSQAIHFFSPFLSAITESNSHNRFAAFLEKRNSVDYLCSELEKEIQRYDSASPTSCVTTEDE